MITQNLQALIRMAPVTHTCGLSEVSEPPSTLLAQVGPASVLKILPGIFRGDELWAEPAPPAVKLLHKQPAWVRTQGSSRAGDLFIGEVVLRRAHPSLDALSPVLGGVLLCL